MKTIKVYIAKDGAVTIKTKGFVGQACKDATRALEKALGAVDNREYTDEYYTQSTATNRLNINGN